MNEIKIEKSVPIPPFRVRWTLSSITKAAMSCEVNDSFVVTIANRSNIYGHLKTAIKRGRKFTTRMDGDKLRVWRIA